MNLLFDLLLFTYSVSKKIITQFVNFSTSAVYLDANITKYEYIFHYGMYTFQDQD